MSDKIVIVIVKTVFKVISIKMLHDPTKKTKHIYYNKTPIKSLQILLYCFIVEL